MDDLLFARGLMALSLGFHILFAAGGIAMPVLMVAAEILWRRTGDETWHTLTRAWAKGTAILFAIGAVSGTVLSFELGLLFPGFMEKAGAVIGMPFSLEGFAFFTEAIFLGVYLYGWERVRPRLHIAAGVMVALSGLASAAFVLLANAWMNAPRGFRFVDGKFVDVDPIVALTTPFGAHEILHMAIAAYLAIGFAAAAIAALALLRKTYSVSREDLHRKALTLSLALAIPCALVQPLVGHFAGQQVAHHQPMKLAAAEGLIETRAWAPVHLGPIPIPGGLSILAFNDPRATVRGLEEIPREDWPHPIVRWSFQVMVLLGVYLAAVAAWALYRRLRKRAPWESRALLWAIVAAGPMGFVAIEAGWVVTEVGRQPWIIYEVVRTSATVTPMPGLIVPFFTFTLVYIGLSIAVTLLMRRITQDA